MRLRAITFSSILVGLLPWLSPLNAQEIPFSDAMLKITEQPKYVHASWGLYVKDLTTDHVLYDVNSNKMLLPASTTKLFSVAVLLSSYGTDYRLKTLVFATGHIQEGIFEGNLILVAQGDLTFGGRQGDSDTIAFTKLDHIIANNVPGTILTPQDPLHAFSELAKQIKKNGHYKNQWRCTDRRSSI